MPKKAAKDPNKPKQPLSGYMRFVQDIRDDLKKENPGASITDIARLAGEKWRECSEADKEKYQKAYKKDKAKYDIAMQSYVPPKGSDAGKKRKKVKDPNAPKKPLTAYFAWMSENRERIKNENDGASIGEVAKIAGEEWRELDASSKSKYEKAYKAAMEKYKVEMANYKPGKVSASKGKKSKKVVEPESDDGESTSSLSDEC